MLEAIELLKLTNTQNTPILIFLTDGEGKEEKRACMELEKFAFTCNNLITLAVGYGS